MVRKDVIEPLGAAGIEVWILAGNHDQPRRAARSTSLDDYRGYPHVRVFREPKREIREIGGRKIGFILVPYLHPEQVMEQVRESLGTEVPRETAYEVARQTWKEWIQNRAQELKDADLRILFGHFEFQGVRYATTAPPEVVPNDFTFTPDMIPDALDLVVFGHIHMHQVLGRRIVYTGAPERIDWGERLDPKGFLAIRPDGGWPFVELPSRPMDRVDVSVGIADDATEKVLAALPKDVAGHLVRIEIALPDELRNRLDEKRLAERLREAFHYEVKFLSTSRPRIVADDFTLDPVRLLADYVDKVLADHPRREAIKVEARRVLQEAAAGKAPPASRPLPEGAANMRPGARGSGAERSESAGAFEISGRGPPPV